MPPLPTPGQAAIRLPASPEDLPPPARADRPSEWPSDEPARAPEPPAALAEEQGQATRAVADLPPDREGRGAAGADAADAAPPFAPAAGSDPPRARGERQASPLPRAGQPRAGPLGAGPADPPAHSVSIGRIEIVVAEPPAAPAGPERTRGFHVYARLRGGMER
ncbi:MAG: hypothetical protein SNJ63_07250 [Sphingomonadaceae bacterium]